jgi:hypothetical protein
MRTARLLGLIFLTIVGLGAANLRLYLTDGTWHLVREYKVEGDRVRFYSVERGDWEEIPKELTDLKKTEAELADRDREIKEEAKVIDEEDKAERAARKEIARVPQETGVYLVEGEGELKALKQAEIKIVNNKRRNVLKALSPIPIVSGKATAEIDGLTSPTAVASNRPEFYFRLVQDERFGIVRLKALKMSRLVETWNIIPVTKEMIIEQEEIEIYRKQVAEGLFKIWPIKELPPGEYAVVEFTENKGNTQVWDFRYSLGTGK